VAYAELGAGSIEGGRVLYAWHRLLDDEQKQALLYDIFNFVADRATE